MTKTATGNTIQYHVFTHEQDDWFDTEAEAQPLFDKWAAENGSARIYIEEHTPGDDGEMVNEDCLQAVGDFPW